MYPLVWRVRAQAMMPSICLRTMAATASPRSSVSAIRGGSKPGIGA
jgi:hypothetical protein